MNKKLVFVTNNPHKLKEISSILADQLEILSLKDINCHEDIPETAKTLEGNALLKAQFIYDKYNIDCFADDTGLEVEALNGEPGVYSARYASERNDSEANKSKLLKNMQGKKNRKAQFRTVISLILNGEKHQFEGIIKGQITTEERGISGFGYDPIFIPEGYNLTFAELGDEIKNKISHRSQAVNKLCKFLYSIQ